MAIKLSEAIPRYLGSPLQLMSAPEGVSTFEGIRRYETTVSRDVARGGGAGLLSETVVQCQKGGLVTDANRCLRCPRFVNIVPSTDRRQITIRCNWSGQDYITELMTRESALVTVSHRTSCAAANRVAERHGVRYLMVIGGDALVGVICRCQTMVPSRRMDEVSEWMTCRLGIVDSSDTLANAAATMAEHDVDIVLVVVPDSDRLRMSHPQPSQFIIGVVTREDLQRCGVDDSIVGATSCMYCGTTRNVCSHSDMSPVQSCLSCLEDAMHPIPFEELGTGD